MNTPQDQTQVSPLMQAIQTEIDRHQSRVDKYQKEFADNLLYAIEWHTETYAKYHQVLRRLTLLLKAIESGKQSEIEAVKHFLERVTESLIDWSAKQSSSAIANALHDFQREGDKEFCDLLKGFIIQFGGNDKA